jgi:general secretion pathway protein E
MLNLEEVHNRSLEPLEQDDYEIALKNFVLYSVLDEETIICVSKQYFSIAFDFISKQDFEYKIIILDEISFDTLYNKFIELKADKQMSEIAKTQEEATLDEDDISISEFLKTSADIMTSEESAPIIKFVNSLFYQAIKKKSSDIHIELHEFKGEVRYRVDGVLSKHIELDKNIMNLVISRIKVISNLDISEKRVPQDGRTAVKISGKTLDIRVSVLPTFYGERVVMRILMQSEDIPTLENLGIDNNITSQLEKLTLHSHGMILVTGPTGSGKSTTLHSLLQKIEDPNKNIITVEDPVEYKSDNINQIQVNSKVGLTFASGLRSILRQDPDIIMVGEIRDTETANIAVQAALTGHMVFSTLHTNTAPAAITRLIDMGVEKFLISSSVLAVLAQRLVRQLCHKCKEKNTIFTDVGNFSFKDGTTIYKSVGCSSCNYTGYSGRKAIAELFVLTDDVKSALKDNVDDNMLFDIAKKNGMVSIKEQLQLMCENGDTSLEEAVRIGLN